LTEMSTSVDRPHREFGLPSVRLEEIDDIRSPLVFAVRMSWHADNPSPIDAEARDVPCSSLIDGAG